MKTEDLIQDLTHDLRPVDPLRKSWLRAGSWLLLAFAYVMTALLVMSLLRSAAGLSSTPLLPQLAALFTSVAAALVAFASMVPGYHRLNLIWPVVGIVLWLAALLVEPGGATPPQAASGEWLCIVQIMVGGLPLLAAFIVMARHSAAFERGTTLALGALAVAALMNVAACYSLPHEDNRVTLVWHGSALLALVLLGWFGGRFLLPAFAGVETRSKRT